MRKTWATLPAALEIVGIVLRTNNSIAGLLQWQWPWKLWNTHFQIQDAQSRLCFNPSRFLPAFTTHFHWTLNSFFLLSCLFLCKRPAEEGQTKAEFCKWILWMKSWIWSRSRLNVKAALWFVCVSLSFYLNCSVGTHIFGVFFSVLPLPYS